MDDLDYKIILELQKNSRQSNRRIARGLHVSESTVRRRLNDLVESRTVELTAIPNTVRAGFLTHAFMRLEVDVSNLEAVAEAMVQYHEVIYVGFLSGASHLLIAVLFRSPAELSAFITSELGKIPGIVRADTIMHLKFEKRTFGWLHPDTLPSPDGPEDQASPSSRPSSRRRSR